MVSLAMRPLYRIASIGGAGANTGEEQIKGETNEDASQISRTQLSRTIHSAQIDGAYNRGGCRVRNPFVMHLSAIVSMRSSGETVFQWRRLLTSVT